MAEGLSRKQLLQLVVVVLAGWGVSQALQHVAPIGRDVSTNETAQALLQDRSSPTRDVSDPTLTLVVFTDYQCPACKLANPAMDAAIAHDGHVRVVYKDFPIFGALSEQAARVAIAANRQGIYQAVHSRLMDERRQLSEPVMREAVERSRGNWSQIKRDLQLHTAEIQQQLNRTRVNAFSLGIEGTPAYLAGPILVSGALDEDKFAQLFALGRKSSSR